MTQILGISGSLRKHSYNSALLRAAQEMFPDLIERGEIGEIPLYNGDVEQRGVPESVLALKQRLIEADGLLLVSPEYNNSMPGVLKNVIDWLSRPSLDVRNAFHGKPVALIGASPGGFGTILAQNAWLPVFRTLRVNYWSAGRLMISGASNVFDDQGALVDSDIEHRLDQFLTGFVDFCENAAKRDSDG